MIRHFLAIPLLFCAASAAAQDLREICGDRPGLGTSACTVDAGHVQLELGLADWTRERSTDSRTDTILAGDALARIGIGTSTELRIGWTAYGHQRERDRTTGTVERTSGVGDVTLGFKQNLANPDGSGFSAAVVPFASLPVGHQPIGATTWGVGLLAPLDWEIADGVQLQLTPEIDAQPDEQGKGRHLAYGNVFGIDIAFAEKFDLDLELQALRDRDPSGHSTRAFAAVAIDYEPDKRTQFDIGAVFGLNHNSTDAELYVGISRKF